MSERVPAGYREIHASMTYVIAVTVFLIFFLSSVRLDTRRYFVGFEATWYVTLFDHV
jgi:hypothetical protein